jgi:hypothetical protein
MIRLWRILRRIIEVFGLDWLCDDRGGVLRRLLPELKPGGGSTHFKVACFVAAAKSKLNQKS